MKKRVFYQVMAGIIIASLVYCPYVQAMGEGPIPQEVPGISKELLEIVKEIKKQNNPSAEMTPEHVKKLINTPEAKKMMHDPEVQKKLSIELQSLAKDPEKRRKIVQDNLTPEVMAEIHKNQPALEKKIKEDCIASLQKIDCKALKASGASYEYVAFIKALQDNITTNQGVLVPTKELHDLAKKVPEQGKVSREFKGLITEIEKNTDNPDTTAKLMASLVAIPEFGMMMGDITTQKLNKHDANRG